MDVKSSSAGTPFPPLQKTALRLYSMRFCPYAQRTRLVLEHKNIPYETVNIHLGSKPSWFWERNPLGTVPVLEKGDQVVYESTATCEWLDDLYPHNGLTPTDPYVKARDRILLEYFGKITALFYGKLRKADQLEEGIKELHTRYQFYEDELAKRKGPLFGGNEPSMIDFYIWPHLERMPVLGRRDQRIAVSVTSFPRLARWYGAMYEVPAVKATLCDFDTHDYFLKGFESGSPDYDYGLV
ncbi:glutathione S-transferase omega-1 [Aplysia californica]|uniref:Glutathione S-transferase omega n=1 Tax=Aplysia californica TaxID=6500 RepID=A0ABM1A791_APLCA|nr:glutathione S-transferase omega-1 [Aplysia californica]